MLTIPAPSATSQRRAGVAAAPMVSDVLTLLEADEELEEPRRKALAGALRTLCSAIGQAPSAVPASLAEMNDLLAAVPSSARGRSKKSIDNARSLTKAALLRYANVPKLPSRGTALRPEWQHLADKVSDPRISTGLSRFMRIASYQALAPDAVNDDAVQRIIDAVAQVNWGRDARPFHAQVTEFWNRAVDSVSGWPRQKLTPAQTSARPSHLPLDALPASFQDDLRTYLTWASGADPLAENAPQPLKASTLNLRRQQLR